MPTSATAPQPVSDATPILIGVGQASERPGTPGYTQRSPTALAADAARAACDDALSLAALAPHIDAIYAVRTMADSLLPAMQALHAPFGGPDNVPRAVAQRIGASPAHAIYSPACGDEPQRLLGEACERLARGELQLVLLCGGEAISTVRAAQSAGQALDWAETVPGTLDDRRSNIGVLRTPHMSEHQMLRPPSIYPLFEHARRAQTGLSRADYAQAMGELMAPFSRVAAANPHASSRKTWSAEAIAQADGHNRMIADPHPIAVVARDQVNQGAAVLLSSVGMARALGVPESKWVYLHGYSAVDERMVLERQHLGQSPAMQAAYQVALNAAGVTADQISHFDLYSCFPIAVFAALDALGLDALDPRGFTLTGGLPYFGGAGNNYAMHAIAELVQRLRQQPGSFGLVGANGGLLSSHAVGIYSTRPKPWRDVDSRAAQAAINALPAPPFTEHPSGWATVETYTVLHDKSGPTLATLVGRLSGPGPSSGQRFIATSAAGDTVALHAFSSGEPLNMKVWVRSEAGHNLLALSEPSASP